MPPEPSSRQTWDNPESFAERNDGLYTLEVATAAGLSAQQQARRRSAGRARSMGRGVDMVAGAPHTWRQRVRATAFLAGPRVVISHGTAARLLGASVAPQDWIHVTGPLGRHVRLPGVRGHRTGTMEDSDTTSRQGIPCTTPLRTVIDMSGELTVAQLGTLLDHFLRQRMLDLDDMRSQVNRLRPAPGRSVKRLRMVLAQRIPGYDPGESELEGRLARLIDRAGLPRAAQQHRVTIDGHRFRIDFAWPDRRLYLEGNGFGYHSLASDLDRDASRQNELVLAGWTPIEVTWRMTDQVIERTLRRFLALSSTFGR